MLITGLCELFWCTFKWRTNITHEGKTNQELDVRWFFLSGTHDNKNNKQP